MDNLHDLFEHELKDIYDAEVRLVEALRKQSREATDPTIRGAFEAHMLQTQGQVERLRRVFEMWGREPSRGAGCAGMEGLLEELRLFQRESPAPGVFDVFLLSAAVKVERYEISAYETLIQLASQLGFEDAIEPLSANLEEEQTNLETLAALLHGDTGRQVPRGEPTARGSRAR